MIVMEFFEDSLEIGDAEVTDHIVDQGLELVRRMWDIGLAHRDIKPANLMVQRGELRLIDVFFVQVRPSPWRQAVDLANMMMVLALRTDAPRVYEHALRLFSPDEIAEAFAATRGVASPTQLRTMMKAAGPRPARRVPRARPRESAGSHPAVEPPQDRADARRRARGLLLRGDGRGQLGGLHVTRTAAARLLAACVGSLAARRVQQRRVSLHAVLHEPGRQRLRAAGAVRSIGDPAPLCLRAPRRLALLGIGDRERPVSVLARLRPRGDPCRRDRAPPLVRHGRGSRATACSG